MFSRSWFGLLLGSLLVFPTQFICGQQLSNELLQRAGSGDVSAMLKVARLYESGTKANPVEAARWYMRAANTGDPQAQTKLAILYIEGTGVARDPAAAGRWLMRAASSGYSIAQFDLAGGTRRAPGTRARLPRAILAICTNEESESRRTLLQLKSGIGDPPTANIQTPSTAWDASCSLSQAPI